MVSSYKYRVAKLGSHCLCLTTSDLMNGVIEPISDEAGTKPNNTKTQPGKTEIALANAKQAQSVKPEKTLSPEEANRALWTEQSPGLGFFGFCVFFTIIYLIAVPALG